MVKTYLNPWGSICASAQLAQPGACSVNISSQGRPADYDQPTLPVSLHYRLGMYLLIPCRIQADEEGRDSTLNQASPTAHKDRIELANTVLCSQGHPDRAERPARQTVSLCWWPCWNHLALPTHTSASVVRPSQADCWSLRDHHIIFKHSPFLPYCVCLHGGFPIPSCLSRHQPANQ